MPILNILRKSKPNKAQSDPNTQLVENARRLDRRDDEQTPSQQNTWMTMFTKFGKIIENPDRVLKLYPGKSGFSDVKFALQSYQQIELSDSRINKALRDRKKAVLSTPYDIYCDAEEDDPNYATYEYIRDWVRWLMTECVIDFNQTLENVLDAFGKGFSVCEMMFELKEYDGRQLMAVTELKHREPWQFKFTDEGELRYLTDKNLVEGVPVDRHKHLIFSYQGRYDNPYGESLIGEKLFWYYLLKRMTLQMWGQFLEKYAVPPQIVKYPENADENMKSQVKAAMEQFKGRSTLMIPDNWMHEVVSVSGQSGSVWQSYRDMQDYCNQEITISILGQTLTTEQGSGGGSYALGRVHEGELKKLVQPDCIMLADALNEQMIEPLVRFNFGEELEHVPYLKFDSVDNKDYKADSEWMSNLAKSLGVKFESDFIRDYYDIQIESMDQPEPPTEIDGDGNTQAEPLYGDVDEYEMPVKFAEAYSNKRIESEKKKLLKVEEMLDNYQSSILKAYKPLETELKTVITGSSSYAKARRGIEKAINQKTVRPIATSVTDICFQAYMVGRLQVLEDTADVAQAEFAEVSIDLSKRVLPFDEALNYFADKIPLSYDEFVQLYNKLYDRFFVIAGVDVQNVVEYVKSQLELALQSEIEYPQFKKNVKEVLNRSGITTINASRIDLVYRNAMMGSYGFGKLQQFQTPTTLKLMPNWQYIATLDDRVRPEHLALHGIVRPANDPFWKSYYPPWGHRCRCTVVAYSNKMLKDDKLKVTNLDKVELPPRTDFQNPFQTYEKVSKKIGSLPSNLN